MSWGGSSGLRDLGRRIDLGELGVQRGQGQWCEGLCREMGLWGDLQEKGPACAVN